MALARPASLAENAGLAFFGETLWEPAQLTVRQAKSFLAAQNPTGRPNADVIRRLVGIKSGKVVEYTQIDFPAHFHEQEAGLYLKPASHLQAKQDDPSASWWLNPHANSALRTAIARLDRYLATPLSAEMPAWDWIDSECLPTASLLAVARDDDFAHGVLQSRFFKIWWDVWTPQLSPCEIMESLPFPWPPTTLLSALTRTQEDYRLAIARAARSGAQDQLDDAVAAAYAESNETTDEQVIVRLENLNRQRAVSDATM